ncbi:hypothetical protein [Herbiconiux sp.]|uniref:primase 1D-like protein n=1 Tax=Herbiconiux sp. TaxID=1871186 RepID=UPI0025BDAD3E|nr:hypothetical protein [Herbiconiux sp.]
MSLDHSMQSLLSRVIADLPEGTRLQFATVARAPRLQNRVDASVEAQRLIEAAQAERLTNGTPFWHALFRAGARGEMGVPEEILDAAQYHQHPVATEALQVVVGAKSNDRILKLSDNLKATDVLMLTSRLVLPSGSIAHLPMLDFSVKARLPGARGTVSRSVSSLRVSGELTSTGRSFHLFGRRSMSEADWRDFMARALLLSPITDERWIAHQLVAGYASLRVSRSDKGEAPIPLGTA